MHVHAGQLAVEEVGDDAGLAGAEDFLGNLPAGGKADTRERRMAAAARHLELELVRFGREHDEAALGAADIDCRIHDEGQHVVEHPPRPEGAQAFQQCGNLAKIADRRRRGAIDGGLAVGEEEDHLGAAGPS